MKLYFLFILVAFFTVPGFGQVKKMTFADFDKAVKAAANLSDKKVRREVTEKASYNQGRIESKSTITEEFIPPDRSSWKEASMIGDSENTSEWVVVGGQRYTKGYDGWFKDKPLPESARIWDFVVDADSVPRMTFTSQTKTVAGKKMTILKCVTKGAPDDIVIETTFTMHVGKDGLVYKVERTETEMVKGSRSSEVTAYTYDPKGLKIEVPSI